MHTHSVYPFNQKSASIGCRAKFTNTSLHRPHMHKKMTLKNWSWSTGHFFKNYWQKLFQVRYFIAYQLEVIFQRYLEPKAACISNLTWLKLWMPVRQWVSLQCTATTQDRHAKMKKKRSGNRKRSRFRHAQNANTSTSKSTKNTHSTPPPQKNLFFPVAGNTGQA